MKCSLFHDIITQERFQLEKENPLKNLRLVVGKHIAFGRI